MRNPSLLLLPLLMLLAGAGACTDATPLGGQDTGSTKREPTTFSANMLKVTDECSTFFNEMAKRPATISKIDGDFDTKRTAASVYQCDRTWTVKIPDFKEPALSIKHLYDLQFSLNTPAATRAVFYEAAVLIAERLPVHFGFLDAWVSGDGVPEGHPGHGIHALPQSATAPQVWMLGSSTYGAQLAAHLGLPYAFAWFITDGQGAAQALQLYRSLFKPGVTARPKAVVCVWALAADTEEDRKSVV